MRVFGLGTSDSVEPLHVIPAAESKPSVIGFYYGGGNTVDLDFLLRYIIFEFRRLHPKTKADDPKFLTDPFTGKTLAKRRCSVKVRCCCADSKARAELRSKLIFLHILLNYCFIGQR